jgi:hypothetical protein
MIPATKELSLMRFAAGFCLQFLMTLLQAGLVVWVFCAPLVWILRDGLGPDSHDSGWGMSLCKFAVGWGIPALVLVVPLYGMRILHRRLDTVKPTEPLALN